VIKSPIEDVNRALWRAALEAGAGFTPVTAALARLYQVTYPTQFSQDLIAWRQEVTDATNDHDERLTALEAKRPKLTVSADAMALATWLSLHSQAGLDDPVDYDAITSAFPEATARELQDAAAELEMHGLATVSKAMGFQVRLIVPTYALYALFDPVTLHTSPQADAVATARAALDLDSGDASELEAHLGWPRRRFNPAFALMLTLVHDGRVRKVIQADYPSLGFLMAAEERVRFKALIAEAAPTL
jgi:hypothetical protein